MIKSMWNQSVGRWASCNISKVSFCTALLTLCPGITFANIRNVCSVTCVIRVHFSYKGAFCKLSSRLSRLDRNNSSCVWYLAVIPLLFYCIGCVKLDMLLFICIIRHKWRHLQQMRTRVFTMTTFPTILTCECNMDLGRHLPSVRLRLRCFLLYWRDGIILVVNTNIKKSFSFTSIWFSSDGNFHLTFRHRASCILGQAFHSSPEKAFYIFNQQIYFIIWYLLDRAPLI